MATTTQRTHHVVTDVYTDLTTSIPAAATSPGFVKHLDGAEVEIVKGGAAQPASTVRGTPLREVGEGPSEEWCDADHIWMICRSREGAIVGFDVVE